MAPQSYRVVLCEKLGNAGYDALETMMDDKQKELLTVDRFERRLTEQIGDVRLEIAELNSALRGEIAGLSASVRAEIAGVSTSVRAEIAGVRQEIGTVRYDLVKWMFVFWMGHTFVVAGIVGAMLRFMRP